MPETHPPNLLTPAEAAKILRTTPHMLAKWRCKGRSIKRKSPAPKLPAVKLGRIVLYPRDALEKWIQENVRQNSRR